MDDHIEVTLHASKLIRVGMAGILLHHYDQQQLPLQLDVKSNSDTLLFSGATGVAVGQYAEITRNQHHSTFPTLPVKDGTSQ